MSVDRAGELYIGHPENWYKFMNVQRPSLIAMKEMSSYIDVFNANMSTKEFTPQVVDILQKHHMPALLHPDQEFTSPNMNLGATDDMTTAKKYAQMLH